MFNYTENELKKIKGEFTLTEIHQQPKVWKEVLNIIESRINEIKKYIKLNVDKNTKIIFAGAGTSEFVGNSINQYFISKGLDSSSIATTDIVANPKDYLNPDKETILVSFARSGNSPESVATYDIANEYVKNIKNVVITCNKDGALAKKSELKNNDFIILLPEIANDKSFAMTSSYTGMILAAYLMFDIENFDINKKEVLTLIDLTKKTMEDSYSILNELANEKNDRMVYLGSSNLNGIAQEAHLKLLELTAGEIATFFNSPLGFRHGPKSILNNETFVVMFMNKDKYARKYDIDLIKEMSQQKQAKKIIVIDNENDEQINKMVDLYFNSNLKEINSSVLLGLNYITYAQIYAFYKSVNLGKSPDNPWPTGEVNRVVQGVVIYPFKENN